MDDRVVLYYEGDVPGAKSSKDPDLNKHTVDELKRWLECHVLKKTGKRKDHWTPSKFPICLCVWGGVPPQFFF